MTFQAQVNQEIRIDGVSYYIAEHPHAPEMPYGQEGRQAIVYQLLEGQERKALKVFKPRYQLPGLVALANQLEPFAQLPGLQVCKRTMLTPRRHPNLLRQHTDLTYGVLMPWIEGPTWMEVLLDKREFTPEQSLQLARSLAEILADMEEHRIAHCDLSSSNMLLPALAGKAEESEHTLVQLVDVEQIYGPNIDRPDLLPGGSTGYAHPVTSQGVWSPVADRFSGAILLAEMLGWCDERVRTAAWGESYFDRGEMQQSTDRFRLLKEVMRRYWGDGLANLLERAWDSETLADCGPFGEWLVILPTSVGEMMAQPRIAASAEVRKEVISTTSPLFADGSLREDSPPLRAKPHGTVSKTGRELESRRNEETTLDTKETTWAPAAIAEKEHLNHVFADGWSAFQRGDWARAKELLGEVVLRQPDYAREKQQAARLLADADRRLTATRSGRGRIWSRVAIPIVLLAALVFFGGIAVSALQAQEADRQAQAQATATAKALSSAQESATVQAQSAINATATQVAAIAHEDVKASSTAKAQAISTAEAIAALETSTSVAQSTGTADAIAAVHATSAAQAKAIEANNTAAAQAVVANAQTATAEAQALAQAETQATTQALSRANETATARALATSKAVSEVRASATARAKASQTAQASVEIITIAPEQVSPADRIELHNYPRETTVTWRSVPGAVRYQLEIEIYISRGSYFEWENLFNDPDESNSSPTTSYTFIFWGDSQGRWRVSAIDALGRAGPASPWWTFSYKTAPSP